MSRLNLNKVEQESLDTIVKRYGENKAVVDKFSKMCDADNKKIKEVFKATGKTSHTSGEFTVTQVIQSRMTVNEDMLVEVMKKYNLNQHIKTKEYVDMESLETALYEGDISADAIREIANCKSTKEVVTLRLKRTEKGGDK